MRRQLFMDMPKINHCATKKAVERELFKYREFLGTMASDIQPKLTPSYSIIPPSFTNQFSSSTESIALERIEYEEMRNEYMKQIVEVVNTLKPEERFVIVKRYMEDEIGYDPEIYMDLGVGKTKYYTIKSKAMLRLAFALKIEVYEKNKKSAVKSA